MKLQNVELSPHGDIRIEHHVNSDTYDREVWSAPVARRLDRELLYTHGRSVSVLFAPAQQWLIVNDFAGGSDAKPYLFKRAGGLHYAEVNIREADFVIEGGLVLT